MIFFSSITKTVSLLNVVTYETDFRSVQTPAVLMKSEETGRLHFPHLLTLNPEPHPNVLYWNGV